MTDRVKKIANSSVKKVSVVKNTSSELIKNIKGYDYKEPAGKIGKGFLKVRRKTVLFYKRPFRDISHLSLLIVIIITLLSGVSALFTNKEAVVQINPFKENQDQAQAYLSASEKRILEADSVATIASIYDPVTMPADTSSFVASSNASAGSPTTTPTARITLAADANAAVLDIYKRASITNTGDKYLASLPIVENVAKEGTNNNPIDYVVKDGDTLSGIATKFNITTDTLRYANQLDDVDSLKPGQKLVILPSTGVLHTVVSGDTLASIAKRYNADQSMIISTNNLYGDEIKVGMKLMIPDAEIPEAPKPVAQPSTQVASNSSSSSSISYVASSSGPNHFPYGWCTWWVAQKRYVPWSGNAWQWYGNAQAYGRPVGQKPVAGAIMVTWESGYGHVGYVESASGNSFTISEMNYVGFGRVSTRTVSTSSVPLIGFIY